MMNQIRLEHYDTIAFDVEGTLANTLPTHHAARLEAFKQHGFGHITPDQHALGPTYGSYPADIIGGVLYAAGEIEKVGLFKDNAVVRRVMATKTQLFEELAQAGFDEMPDAVDFVNRVAPRFAGRMALVTSSHERFVTPFLERYDLAKYFTNEQIISEDTLQAEGLEGKPAPDAYQLAMRRLNTDRLLVFEDAVTGVTSAKKAGATVVGLGFDLHNARLFESGTLEYPPDIFARDYADARQLLGI